MYKAAVKVCVIDHMLFINSWCIYLKILHKCLKFYTNYITRLHAILDYILYINKWYITAKILHKCLSVGTRTLIRQCNF